MTPSHPKLQNWAGGTLKPMKLTEKKTPGKRAQEQKWLKILKEKKIKFQPCSQPRHLLMTSQTIGLVVNKYTKLGKKGQKLTLSQGLSYSKIPLC